MEAWKQLKYSSINEWIKDMTHTHTHTHTHTMEYNSALKKRGTLPSGTWMNLKDMMLSEINQIQNKYYMTPLVQGI